MNQAKCPELDAEGSDGRAITRDHQPLLSLVV